MTSDSFIPILYGVPFSQPVRAVMWLLLYKQLPFRMALVNPGSKGEIGSRNPAYLAKNPGGTIPCLEEPDSGYIVAEAHAIMCYLSNKHGWSDVYPDNFQARAKVDWYLHFHHRNVRPASVGLIAPKIRKDLNIGEALRENALDTLTAALHTLNDGWLTQSPFLVGDTVTLADFTAYVEIGQLRDCFANVFDFEPFPNVARWLETMAAVREHDTVHVALREIGDINTSAPTMDTIKAANKAALRAMNERIAQP